LEPFFSAFVVFFSVIDPIGTVPVFIAVSQGLETGQKRKIATRAVIIATALLTGFVVVGELVLDAIQIPLPAFQIAGGIVLFLFALTMIFGDSKPEEELKLTSDNMEKAVYPLAVPSIASPGAMLAAVLLTENARYEIGEQAVTTLAMLSVLLMVWILLQLAPFIDRFLGKTGASIVSRVMGLILSSVAVNHVLQGVAAYFGIS